MIEQSPKVDNLLHLSWTDSRWSHILNTTNVLDYFSERSNPFYNRECNNEFIKMQQSMRPDQLQHMTGVEYVLLHAQEPILYIVRKQHRHSPTHANPLACYHIIGGQVFQTPDLGTVINSRLINAMNYLGSSFNELQQLAGYHPSRGYYWKTQKQQGDSGEDKKAGTAKENAATIFQRRRVDQLLSVLTSQFPPKIPQPPAPPASESAKASQTNAPSQQNGSVKTEEVKTDIKVEGRPTSKQEREENPNNKQPPAKRQKTTP